MKYSANYSVQSKSSVAVNIWATNLPKIDLQNYYGYKYLIHHLTFAILNNEDIKAT